MKLDWHEIGTVLLDLDGTLLDLHFDQHFWQQHLPGCYARKYGLSLQEARTILLPLFAQMEGRLEWYCLDYWSRRLGMDIVNLKAEVEHLIQVHPHVVSFLQAVRDAGKRVVLTTNADSGSVALKMARTGLARYFDVMVSAHQLGAPKEESVFWEYLQERVPFVPQQTLLVDDNLEALSCARNYGIRYLYAVLRPDSRARKRGSGRFHAIADFSEIMPPVESG